MAEEHGRARRALEAARAVVIPAFGIGALVGLVANVPILMTAGAAAFVGLVGGAVVGGARG